MALHRTQSDVGWIKRRFIDIERRIEQLSAARRLESATIGKGGLHVRGGDLFLEDDDGNVIWKASADPLKTAIAYDSADSLDLATSWTRYGETSDLVVQVPTSFKKGHLQVFVSAGDTFSTSGNISVQPAVTFRRQSGATSTFYGPAINSGNASVSVASSFWATNFGDAAGLDTDPYVSLTFGLDAIETSNTNTTDGNWHVSASAIFKRGA